ncbi:MAG: hypothetical protein EA426_02185 [Spirochaetaceae bacterium]|nr:MAG: hypothetical protein EA426_02185 [Spirochaetaceae bacterium]
MTSEDTFLVKPKRWENNEQTPRSPGKTTVTKRSLRMPSRKPVIRQTTTDKATARPAASRPAAYQPASALWSVFRPANAPHAFRSTSPTDAAAWQNSTRAELARCIGLDTIARIHDAGTGREGSASAADPRGPARRATEAKPPRARVIERVEKPDYVREKVVLTIGRKTSMPVYLLLPKNATSPPPVVVAFHGHGYGVKDIVGLWEDGAERDTPDGYHRDFAVELCRMGFAVAAPEISCFGERQTDFSYLNTTIGQPVPTTCAHTAMLAFHLGISVVGLRVHDGVRLVDYLETRKDIDAARLGAMGISGGGMHTFFSTCLDPRISACVVSGYFAGFRNSILAMHHCPCNFVPGLAEFGEMADLAGLIAPRPMLVEAGTYDPIFPIDAVKAEVKRARAVFGAFGARDAVQTDYFEGRHRISGRRAYGFLAEKLGLT